MFSGPLEKNSNPSLHNPWFVHPFRIDIVLNVKALLVGDFIWEKALVEAFFVILNSSRTFVSSCTAGGRGDGVQENRIFSEYPRVQSKSS